MSKVYWETAWLNSIHYCHNFRSLFLKPNTKSTKQEAARPHHLPRPGHTQGSWKGATLAFPPEFSSVHNHFSHCEIQIKTFYGQTVFTKAAEKTPSAPQYSRVITSPKTAHSHTLKGNSSLAFLQRSQIYGSTDQYRRAAHWRALRKMTCTWVPSTPVPVEI